VCRKVAGEAKDEGHGEGTGVFDGSNIPLRRWEDWERSRLRKQRRAERRRRELERAHPAAGGYGGAGELLGPGSTRNSQYDGSDTTSLASADDDTWGGQIGGYNENSAAFPPPPTGLYPHETLAGGPALAGADLDALLEAGFDDALPPARGPPRAPPSAPRFQLADAPGGAYAALSRASSPGPRTPDTPGAGNGLRGGEKAYGPLGPLDPGARY
jgi:chitin synthase